MVYVCNKIYVCTFLFLVLKINFICIIILRHAILILKDLYFICIIASSIFKYRQYNKQYLVYKQNIQTIYYLAIYSTSINLFKGTITNK